MTREVNRIARVFNLQQEENETPRSVIGIMHDLRLDSKASSHLTWNRRSFGKGFILQ